ncbi:alpha-L-arabinofuranosidase C-terminal domain-containing protein [Paenibacillus tarimensis]|uniref:alpha-L-arabinofuranosidase C-terminal domain-containing protein n=1 Tax=Paenibacillus tarimensis TaxID=416012 RepID=UPI001F394D12|nr:alpha-L-arabinofuranosidase C-terminal domain-containing protein [Paenibacillus tarimensis]MCF2945361.1 alpha-L-arabinofuranosidase [Paenibacillus tarimensis]
MKFEDVPFKERLIAQYKFDDAEQIGKDSSGKGNDAEAAGRQLPVASNVGGRPAVTLPGGASGTSYIQLPAGLLEGVSDQSGVTVSTWVYFDKGSNVWERIFDFGQGPEGPYLFLTRNMRATLHAEGDIVADPGKSYPTGEWMHIAMSVIGTKNGTLSSAGPVLYVNGEVATDGSISQTSSGMYAKLRAWFATFNEAAQYKNNYIGRSQYEADADFAGSFSDFRIYAAGLSQDEVIEVMCDSLTDQQIVQLARDKYLSFPASIVTKDLTLPASLMGGKVEVSWTSSHPEVLTGEGAVKDVQAPQGVILTAVLKRGGYTVEKSYPVTVMPGGMPPYKLTIEGGKELMNVSDVMYGLFYEDINNAADGGIYAELVRNRSFEAFTFDTYNHHSGENGVSTGRNHNALEAWSGDTDKVKVQNSGGLNDHFGLEDKEVNAYYVTVADGATLYNRGFNDTNGYCAMAIREGARYLFTIWAKADKPGTITIQLKDPDGGDISDAAVIEVEGGGTWKKYGAESQIVLTGSRTVLGQLALVFSGEISIDMVSLYPEEVWGVREEPRSASAHANYTGNPNYRLRRDLVEALLDLHPTFLRFPGGCISEGSHIWENVYDWKESVRDIELRKENFNVWGYMMTMGLGYMEYFQLAEDLNATPLPVMACGVLCQARSDYCNPAGGALRDYYIKNFTDLIDFAISVDFEHNEWAALRRQMGHEAPFDLRYLGVGNENWGTEFYANFEVFKAAIDEHMAKFYPDHELHIISTVGAQADDDAYQEGWKFLSGRLKGEAKVSFTDGKHSHEETITWYEKQPNYMDTIADEHYYRSNEYLLNNVDRYNYYYRAYEQDGSLNLRETSKVFVGEYASTDKNTLAGAVAEAAMMTGFENNADVVLLTAYAPLFNKVLTDGTYRWTPDCIWFDDETVWFTPNYYVQQLFAKYAGKKVLGTSFRTYRSGKPLELIPRGGIEIAAGNAEVIVKRVKVTSHADGRVLLDQDFTQQLDGAWQVIPGSAGYTVDPERGLVLKAQSSGRNGLYILNDEWTNYKVEVTAVKGAGTEGFFVGAGLTDIMPEKKDVIEYAIGYNGNATGVKVYKQGIEGYTLGDYSSSSAAGNLRACSYEPLTEGAEYAITVDFGGGTGDRLVCSYTDGKESSLVLDYKLEAYNRDVFSSVTKDDKHVYVKLVNADGTDKTTELELKDLNVAAAAKVVTLTGDESLLNIPNVNKKNDEKVQPAESSVTIDGTTAVLTLPAHSVTVLVLDLA